MSRYINSDITRYTPSCFCFILDQSSSMAEPYGERDGQLPVTKAEAVAMALNNLLRNLILSCSKSDGVRDYFEIAVLGYGAEVGPVWQGALRGQELVPISQVADNVLRLDEHQISLGNGTTETIRTPVWITPQAHGSTTMCAALQYAHDIISLWSGRNPSSHPPVIVHITDGEATDGDPAPHLEALTSLGTGNGRATLFNVHLSSRRTASPLSFPDQSAELPDPYARLLFDKASYLTPYMRTVAWENGLPLTEAARAFVLNADPSLLVLALEIGTRPGRLW
ncbi:vWA domain-containing protein [Armatimonas sp.]|uniref:vWA domain-containing protein n=1 Tax=Armatimonas sp. TaxID=1872638 RepID=UPI003753AA15